MEYFHVMSCTFNIYSSSQVLPKCMWLLPSQLEVILSHLQNRHIAPSKDCVELLLLSVYFSKKLVLWKHIEVCYFKYNSAQRGRADTSTNPPPHPRLQHKTPQVRGSHAALKTGPSGEGETVCVLSRAVLLQASHPPLKHNRSWVGGSCSQNKTLSAGG